METPSLLYHKVTPRWDAGVVWIPPDRFRRQMEALHRDGWHTEAAAARRFNIFFDDGYECVHRYALPLLARLGFTATVFIPAAYINAWNDWDHQLLGRRFRHLSREMLQELVAAGWRIGSHGMSHRPLDRVEPKQLRRELAESRRVIEDASGRPVEAVSFPFGRFNRRVLMEAVAAGYTTAVVPPDSNEPDCDGMEMIPAESVYLWDTPATVENILAREEQGAVGTAMRSAARLLNRGTILWQRIFVQGAVRKPLA